jgi:thiol-disulfide isomerase/thioredoxin
LKGFILTFLLPVFAIDLAAQTRPLSELATEVDNYVNQRTKDLIAEGKRVDSAKRDDLADERKALARKYAEQASARTDLKDKDIYYLGLLYTDSGDDQKALDAMRNFLAQYPPETKGDMIQSARSYVIVLAARRKQLDEAEQTLKLWQTGSPLDITQQPVLQEILAVGFFKDGQYEKAVNHGQAAFDLLKTIKPKTVAEKRSREKLYEQLVEVLALGYKKNKNADRSLEVLAEARAESFALPSADLYRKVMDFVQGSGFSEKKLMQKVESYATADPAPNLTVNEWIGQEPSSLDALRGKVVLLDFWATWCMPCISTFPRLRGWHKKYAGNDFTIIGVTQYYGQQDGKKMSRLQEGEFLKEFKAKYKLPYGFAVLANSGEAPMKYGINAYPTTVLLDRNGVVRYIGIGAGPEESQNLEEMIQKVLREGTRLAEK